MKPTKPITDVIDGTRRSVIVPGDCIIESRRIPDGCVDAVVVDPPYGMSYKGLNNKKPAILNDTRPFVWFLPEAFRVTKAGGALICFCQWRMQEDFRRSIELAGWRVASHVIWTKNVGGMGNTACTFAPQHEVIWFATKGRFSFQNGRPPSILRHANIPPHHRDHSTQKPTPLMSQLIEAVTPKGGLVFDPTCGSGSTGVAAIQTGRRFIGMELDPVNYRTARRRLSQATTKPKAAPSGGRGRVSPTRPHRMVA